MKTILTITLIIFNISVFGQSLFFNELKVIDFKVPRSSESYESRIIRINNHDTLIEKADYPIGLEWNPINENEIVGCNLWICGKWNLKTNKFDTLYNSNESQIMELTSNTHSCYILTTPFEQERFDNYKLLKIDIKSKQIEEIDFPKKYKILNLCASNKNLSFIDYNYNSENNFVLAKLIICKTDSKDCIQIDQASSKENEWFGGVDDRSNMYWRNDNELYYFKKEKNKANGTIFKYDIKNKSRTREFELPYDRINSFAIKDNGLIILNNKRLIFMDKQGNEKVMYQVGYEYDYILNQFYVR